MAEELQELVLSAGHRRVGRLMRENGIKIVRTRKYKATTVSAVPAPLGFCLQAGFAPMSANIFALVIAHNELTEESRMSSL